MWHVQLVLLIQLVLTKYKLTINRNKLVLSKKTSSTSYINFLTKNTLVLLIQLVLTKIKLVQLIY